MRNDEYRSLLGQLPLKNPSPEEMARFCPHLTQKEAVNAFMKGNGYVACPPIRVRNGFQILSYSKERVEGIALSRTGKETVKDTKNHPAILSWAFAGRTPDSYVNRRTHGDSFIGYKHTDEAIAFAERNWPEDLLLDDWESVMQFNIQDPTDLVNDKYHKDYPRTKSILYVTMGKDLNEFINDRSKPMSELFDDVISHMTLDFVVWHELKGGRGGFEQFNCAHCAGGLTLDHCSNCGHKFKDDNFRSGTYTPLSKKMISFLIEKGYNFKMDPEIALKRERQAWEKLTKKQ